MLKALLDQRAKLFFFLFLFQYFFSSLFMRFLHVIYNCRFQFHA